MTSSEMHIRVRQAVQRMDTFLFGDLQSEEIDLTLNIAQNRFVKQRFAQFEQSQKRVDDLRTILRRENISPVNVGGSALENTGIPNATRFEIPSDYLFYVHSLSYLSREGLVPSWVGNEVIPHDMINKMVKSDFNDPIFHHPFVVFQSNNEFLVIHRSTDILSEVQMVYLKEPVSIEKGEQDCELPPHTHDEIVDIAVNIIIERLEPGRVESNELQLRRTE
jgi:hypothetical protein